MAEDKPDIIPASNNRGGVEYSGGFVIREDEIKELISACRRSTRLIFVILLTSVGLGALTAFSLTEEYKAIALLAPNNPGQGGGRAEALASVASLTGLSLSTTTNDNTGYSIEVLKSRRFLESFVSKSKAYQESIPSETISDPVDHVRSNTEIHVSSATGLVSVAYYDKSASSAELVLSDLIDSFNEYMRKRDIDQSIESIAYIESQIKKNNKSELHDSLYRMIEDHMRVMTLANIKKDYRLEIIDPPYSPTHPHWPNKKIIILIFLILGVMITAVLIYYRMRSEINAYKSVGFVSDLPS